MRLLAASNFCKAWRPSSVKCSRRESKVYVWPLMNWRSLPRNLPYSALRKKSAAVIFTSQSLTDVERCAQRSIIVESCQTKIFLPNAEARTTQSAQLYRDLGLNEREIELLAAATPK